MATTLTPQTSATVAPTAAKNPYKGYNDPLAQEIYKKYNPWITQKRPSMRISPWDQMMQHGEFYGRPGSGVRYYAPYDPSTWGTSHFGPTVDKMKAEYLARGGLGTTEQFYAQQAAARKAEEAAKTATAGSQHSLAPEILNKMWR